MITIRTADFVGILADVVPFATTDAECPETNAVRVEWDGSQLHALATDLIRVGISSWHPDDAPEIDAQDDVFTNLGGADEPWAVNVALDDAKHLIKTYKLPVKQGNTLITVEYAGGDMKVIRSRDTGHSAITVKVDGQPAVFPAVRDLLSSKDALQEVTGLAFGARFIADFGKVRPRGPLELEFTGTTSLTHVRIGERFLGAIMPTRLGDEREREPAAA